MGRMWVLLARPPLYRLKCRHTINYITQGVGTVCHEGN